MDVAEDCELAVVDKVNVLAGVVLFHYQCVRHYLFNLRHRDQRKKLFERRLGFGEELLVLVEREELFEFSQQKRLYVQREPLLVDAQ